MKLPWKYVPWGPIFGWLTRKAKRKARRIARKAARELEDRAAREAADLIEKGHDKLHDIIDTGDHDQ